MPRIFAIADWLRENSPDLEVEITRLVAACRATGGHDAEAQAAGRAACAFLRDGDCGIYPVRPAACQGLFSLSLEACIAGAQG